MSRFKNLQQNRPRCEVLLSFGLDANGDEAINVTLRFLSGPLGGQVRKHAIRSDDNHAPTYLAICFARERYGNDYWYAPVRREHAPKIEETERAR